MLAILRRVWLQSGGSPRVFCQSCQLPLGSSARIGVRAPRDVRSLVSRQGTAARTAWRLERLLEEKIKRGSEISQKSRFFFKDIN